MKYDNVAMQVNHQLHVLRETGDSADSLGRALCDAAGELNAAAVVAVAHSHGGLEEAVMSAATSWLLQHCDR